MQWFNSGSIIALDNLSLWQVKDFPQSSENTVSQICAGLISIPIKEIPQVLLTAWIACKFLSVKKKEKKNTKSPWADILTAALFLILILWGLSVSHICSGAEGGTGSLVLVKCHFHVPVLPEDRLNLYFLLLKLQVFPLWFYSKNISSYNCNPWREWDTVSMTLWECLCVIASEERVWNQSKAKQWSRTGVAMTRKQKCACRMRGISFN